MLWTVVICEIGSSLECGDMVIDVVLVIDIPTALSNGSCFAAGSARGEICRYRHGGIM
jgi:hypothetical protein